MAFSFRLAGHLDLPDKGSIDVGASMTLLCLGLAFGLTLLLGFVSHIQLLYLESIRIIRRETQSLQYFRETLAGQIGLELELGSLSFSLVKHALLFLIG